jgi:uracil-DNA glycosylase
VASELFTCRSCARKYVLTGTGKIKHHLWRAGGATVCPGAGRTPFEDGVEEPDAIHESGRFPGDSARRLREEADAVRDSARPPVSAARRMKAAENLKAGLPDPEDPTHRANIEAATPRAIVQPTLMDALAEPPETEAPEPPPVINQPVRDHDWEGEIGLNLAPGEHPVGGPLRGADEAVVFKQPDKPERRTRIPLTGEAAEHKARILEIFWAHVNSSDRTQQTTLGPSEVGDECDRALAFKLAGQPHVNPGTDGWAAWVGTQIHAGLEEMFRKADRGRGRYAVEQNVEVSPPTVPRGTFDLGDRVLGMVQDHKSLGKSSLSNVWLDGRPSEKYITQLMVYAFAANKAGGSYDKVALLAWPRESPNLNDMWVWVAPYDEERATSALNRAHAIDDEIRGGRTPWSFDKTVSFGCKFCPFHQPGQKDPSKACAG